jgi:pyrroline-5-carboxylate reductase
VEALADGGVLMGLPRDLALQLAAQTVRAPRRWCYRAANTPPRCGIKSRVPAARRSRAWRALERTGLRAALIAAVRAATERSRQLGESK